MATTKTSTAGTAGTAGTEAPGAAAESGHRLIEDLEKAENAALEAVRAFVDSVDNAFPDITSDSEGLRRTIIDSAFSMVEQLVSTSNRLAQDVVDVTDKALKSMAERS